MLLTTLAHKQHDFIWSTDQTVFSLLHSRFLVKVEFAVFPFLVHEWQHLVTSKHIYHWHWNTFSVVISNIFGKKTEYYCNISVGSINGTAKKKPNKLEDIDHFDLKFYPNCHIRIEMIKLWYCSSLFLREYYS